ncbi:alcohol dehydrogenase [Colletotrichum orchidophilum]|uniref:Alcohol dehydrogenase n=1 Tax=Colletotrichum orchidophilum TaxID=1209926 RepID=A0A1G4BH35_9PEZI|nr:alcohol dehydrogenase [Colletotrichum orchidophilum]OHF00709.1 alcohol dehydrogenase [Colletotrichum orchidophilum]
MAKTFTFQDIPVKSPSFGAMGLSFGMGSKLSLEEAEHVLLQAIELGCTLWDTSIFNQVVYEAGVDEKLLGDFTRKHNVRDKECIEHTIERLGFTPDLYYLHRIDPIANIDALQAENSAFETLHEADGLIEAARELGVAYVAYSPLGHGVIKTLRGGPKFQGKNRYKNKAIVDEIKKLANRKGCSLPQIALARVDAHRMIPIHGTTKTKRLEEKWVSRNVILTE